MSDPRSSAHLASPPDMLLELQELLPLRSLVITLRFTELTAVSFFHQAPVYAFVRHLLDSELDFAPYMLIHTPETGRVNYRAGDLYRFQLFFLNGTAENPEITEDWLEDLIDKLSQLPDSAKVTDRYVAFRNNLTLVDIQDSFTGDPIQTAEDCYLWDEEDLNAEADEWQIQAESQNEMIWQWLSPVRIYKDKNQKGQGRRDQDYCKTQGDCTPELLLERSFDSLSNLLRSRKAKTSPRLAPPVLDLTESDLFWLDNSYTNQEKNKKPMGGLHGQITLSGLQKLPISWWRLLVLGQYLGIGQRRAFGWGRYVLQTKDSSIKPIRLASAYSLIYSVSDQSNLQQALNWTCKNTLRQSHSDHQTELSQPESQDPKLPSIDTLNYQLGLIENGQYQIPETTTNLTPRGNLTPPQILDQILQTACAQVLHKIISNVLPGEKQAFRGRTASHSLMPTTPEVLTTSERQVLISRLHTLFGPDPLIEQCIRWLQNDKTQEAAPQSHQTLTPILVPVLAPLLVGLKTRAVLSRQDNKPIIKFKTRKILSRPKVT